MPSVAVHLSSGRQAQAVGEFRIGSIHINRHKSRGGTAHPELELRWETAEEGPDALALTAQLSVCDVSLCRIYPTVFCFILFGFSVRENVL